MSFNKIPLIGNEHSEETRNIINLMVQVINNRGIEILSESSFLTWLDENGVKHQGEWDDTKEYDRLSVVLHEGNSYTSVKTVPVGIDILNEEFWVVTGNYNAQVEYYRDEVRDLSDHVDTELDKKSDQTYVENEVNKKVDGTIETLDLYVSIDGNDNNSGSINSPFKTLSRAVEEIPDVIRKDHVVTVNLNSGVWDEILLIENKTIQGQLIVKGTTDDRENHKVLRVYTDSLTGDVLLENLTTTAKIGNGQSFRIRRSTYVDINNVKSESDSEIEKGVTGVIGLLADYGSNVRVRNSDFSGKRYGIRCNYLSRVFSSNNTGENNTFGIGSRWGGIISTYGTQPKGNTNTTVSSGGLLTTDSGGYSGLPNEPYLINAKRSSHDGVFSMKEYYISTVNGSSVGLSRDDKLRIRFRGTNHGMHYMRVRYSGETSSTSGQAIEKIFTFMLRANSFLVERGTHVHEHSMSTDKLVIQHTGSNETFDIIVDPLVALSGRWALVIESEMHRHFTAPVLESVEIIT